MVQRLLRTGIIFLSELQSLLWVCNQAACHGHGASALHRDLEITRQACALSGSKSDTRRKTSPLSFQQVLLLAFTIKTAKLYQSAREYLWNP
jgi:hypothetical protein